MPTPKNETEIVVSSGTPVKLMVVDPSASTVTNEAVLTPQVIIDLFHTRTSSNDNRNADVLVPLQFTPPVAEVKPSSTATYESR